MLVGFEAPVVTVNENSGRAVITVELDNPSNVPFTVVLSTQNGTATGDICIKTTFLRLKTFHLLYYSSR